MRLTDSERLEGDSPGFIWRRRNFALFLLFLVCSLAETNRVMSEQASMAGWAAGLGAMPSATVPGFKVTTYVVRGGAPLSTNVLATLFAPYTGANVSVAQLVRAAAALHQEFVHQGAPGMSVAIPLQQISNGVVKLNVFATAVPQVVVSGRSFLKFTNAPEIVIPAMAGSPSQINFTAENPPPSAGTNTAPTTPLPPTKPATPGEIAEARAELIRVLAAPPVPPQPPDTRIHVVSTNSGPRFAVQHYLVLGNTVLPPPAMAEVLTNIDGAFGTNVSFEGVHTVAEALQKAYPERR